MTSPAVSVYKHQKQKFQLIQLFATSIYIIFLRIPTVNTIYTSTISRQMPRAASDTSTQIQPNSCRNVLTIYLISRMAVTDQPIFRLAFIWWIVNSEKFKILNGHINIRHLIFFTKRYRHFYVHQYIFILFIYYY